MRYFNTESNVQVVFSVTELIAEQILNTELYRSAENELISKRYAANEEHNKILFKVLGRKIVHNAFMENLEFSNGKNFPDLNLFSKVHFKDVNSFTNPLPVIPEDSDSVSILKSDFVYFLRKHEDVVNACINVDNV